MVRNNFRLKMKKWNPVYIVGAVIGGIILVVTLGALFGLVVQYLWNWIMPGIFNIREITYLEAFGIMILARMLVGGFGGGGKSGGSRSKGKYTDSECCNELEELEYYEEWWEKEGKGSLKNYTEKKKAPKAKTTTASKKPTVNKAKAKTKTSK